MSHDPHHISTQVAGAGVREVDAGLQSYMRQVFNTMGMGLAVTGLAAWAVANIEPLYNAIFGTMLYWVAMLAPLVFVFAGFTPARIARMSVPGLRGSFYAFSGLMGVSMASLLYVFSGEDFARAFFITAATFAGMSLLGYTTKRDLTGVGSFMIMGLIGILIAGLVNLFMQSLMVHFVVSVLSVVIFTGLTAFEVQRLKYMYSSAQGMEEANAKAGIMGALGLYLSFINLFQSILYLTGGGRD